MLKNELFLSIITVLLLLISLLLSQNRMIKMYDHNDFYPDYQNLDEKPAILKSVCLFSHNS